MEVESNTFRKVFNFFSSRATKRPREERNESKKGYKRAAISSVRLPDYPYYSGYESSYQAPVPIQDDKVPQNIEYSPDSFNQMMTKDMCDILNMMFTNVNVILKQPVQNRNFPNFNQDYNHRNDAYSNPQNQYAPSPASPSYSNCSTGTPSPGCSTSDEEQYLNSPMRDFQDANDQRLGGTIVHCVEQPFWGKIAYYELSQRIGDPILCTAQFVTLDGFMKPSAPESEDRFSLCSMTSGNAESLALKTHIGNGLRLSHSETEIHLHCLSNSPVFIQSRLFNYMHRQPFSTVCKLLPNRLLKIFDYEVFNELLQSCIELGYEAVHELTKMCTIRISFVKGWGGAYHRADVTATPCWIELHVYEALQFLDEILLKMYHPSNRVTSVS